MGHECRFGSGYLRGLWLVRGPVRQRHGAGSTVIIADHGLDNGRVRRYLLGIGSGSRPGNTRLLSAADLAQRRRQEELPDLELRYEGQKAEFPPVKMKGNHGQDGGSRAGGMRLAEERRLERAAEIALGPFFEGSGDKRRDWSMRMNICGSVW